MNEAAFARHEDRVSSDYDEIWSADPAYPDRLSRLIADALALEPEHRLADVGSRARGWEHTGLARATHRESGRL